MILGAFVAAIVAAVGLFAFGRVSWPAFPVERHTGRHDGGAGRHDRRSRAVCRPLPRPTVDPRGDLLSWAGLSGFVTVTLGMPLSATKLYLHGVSVDQEFRTEYLTRLTDSAALHDMTYADLPPYYPAGWFWIGGRVANLLGMDAGRPSSRTRSVRSP